MAILHPRTFAYALIQRDPLHRGEAFNIGVLLWDVDSCAYQVAVDTSAVIRSQRDAPKWFADFHITPDDFAAHTQAFIGQQIEAWAAKPLTDASLRAWMLDPHFGTYSDVFLHVQGAAQREDDPQAMESVLLSLMRHHIHTRQEAEASAT